MGSVKLLHSLILLGSTAVGITMSINHLSFKFVVVSIGICIGPRWTGVIFWFELLKNVDNRARRLRI